MESLPAGMVASALQSRIAYLTKHVENLPAKGGEMEVIRVPQMRFAAFPGKSQEKRRPRKEPPVLPGCYAR
jgi:hypothetical protein